MFFIWGLLLVIYGKSAGTLLGPIIMILVHACSILGLYLAFQKDEKGKRYALGIVLNSITLIYTLGLDFIAALI